MVAAAVARLLHKPQGAVRACDGLRLGAVDEPRPARLAELACDRELRIGELERLAARRARASFTRCLASRRARSRSIRPASITDHLRVARGPQRRAEVDRNTTLSDRIEVACGPARGPGCALARSVDATAS